MMTNLKESKMKYMFACIKLMIVAVVLVSAWWLSAVWLESIA